MLGVNITSHSRTQQSAALSSGEAELYAIGSGVADSLFARSSPKRTFVFSQIQRLVSPWQDVSELPVKPNTYRAKIPFCSGIRSIWPHKVTEGSWNFESRGYFSKVCEQGYSVSPPGNFWTYPQVVFPLVSL